MTFDCDGYHCDSARKKECSRRAHTVKCGQTDDLLLEMLGITMREETLWIVVMVVGEREAGTIT